MRIAQVSATFPPYWAGTGNVAFNNARLAAERGHTVQVFTAHHDRPRGGADDFPFRVERLDPLFRLGDAPFTPDLLSRLRGFDLIHLHHPYIFGAELTLLASVLYGIPFVLSYHNRLEEERALKRALFAAYNRAIEPLLLARAARVLAVRREHLAAIHPRLAASDRLEELVNGLDSRVFVPLPKDEARRFLNLPQSVPLTLFVGALDRAHRFKNVDGLLRAFVKLREEDAQLVIAGGGDLRPGLERLAGELGISSRVHFLGALPPAGLPPVYSAADITVLPSTSVESFGLVLIESLACGTAVIASDLPGVRELARDRRSALLTPPRDEDALVTVLDDALASRASLNQRALMERPSLLARYDWSAVGDRLVQIYGAVAARAPEVLPA